MTYELILSLLLALTVLAMATTSIWGIFTTECWKSETREARIQPKRIRGGPDHDRFMILSKGNFYLFLVFGIATCPAVWFVFASPLMAVALLAIVFICACVRAENWQRTMRREQGRAGITWRDEPLPTLAA